MKKLILIAAVAFAAISCASKSEQAAPEEEAAAPVEVVEEAPAPAAEAAPAEEKEKSLIQRAVELGEDVAAEVEKQK